MDRNPILINEPQAGPKKPAADVMLGWSLLQAMGWLFVVVGLLNIVLIWIPLQVGNPEFEFGAAANSLDSLPLPTMGLVWAMAAGRARANARGTTVAVGITYLLALLVVGAGALYWLDVPLALQAVKEPMIRLGIDKSILKVTVQAVLYPVALVAMARMARSRSS